MERSSRSFFLLGENFSDAETRRHLFRLSVILIFCAACALLNRVGDPVPMRTIQPVLASMGSVNSLVQERQASMEDLRRELEWERLRRSALERKMGESGRGLEAPSVMTFDTTEWNCATVLGTLPSAWERQFVIKLSSDADEFREGDPVFATTNDEIALVGRIVEIEEGNAKVLSITDPSSSVPVKVDGYGGGVLFRGGYPSIDGPLLYVPVDAMIKPGAIVRAAWPDEAVGAVVGTVSYIRDRDSVFMNVGTIPAVRPENMRYVWLRRK